MRNVTLWLLVIRFAAIADAQQHIVTEVRQLQVQVLSNSSHAIRAKVELRSYERSNLSTQTDRLGIGHFYAVPAGNYTLVVSVRGKEVYRDQLSLMNAEGFRNEVVRLHSAGTDGPQVVSLDELNVPKNANDHYIAGVKAIGIRDWEKGLVALNNAIKAHPKYAKAHNAVGVVLAIRSQLSEAESAFRRAIELNPKFAEPHFNLGKLLLESERLPEARLELERNIQLDGGHSSAIELLVETTVRMHDEDSAVSLMRSLHLKNIKHAALLHLEIGSALERHSKVELAAEQYSLLLKENSSESERREAELGLSRLKLLMCDEVDARPNGSLLPAVCSSTQ
jgi:tetratricopeptide (TPR) repeat protein